MGRFARIVQVFLVLFFIGTSAAVSAETNTETYENAEATISGPDVVEPNEDFEIKIKATITSSFRWKVYIYGVYENADWHYDSNHHVVISSYDRVIEKSGFKWGSGITKTYTLNREEGEYTYTFLFIDASAIHRAYGLAVDIDVIVKPRVPTTGDIDDYIQSLPDDSFKNDNGNLKKALHNKLKALQHQIEVEDYESAVGKLPSDIMDMIDKWITDDDAKKELIEMSELLLKWIEDQL